MMRERAIAPADRRDQVGQVGCDLVEHYGEKYFCSAQDAKEVNRRCKIEWDGGCASPDTVNTPSDIG
jgi:hypothetical protein